MGIFWPRARRAQEKTENVGGWKRKTMKWRRWTERRKKEEERKERRWKDEKRRDKQHKKKRARKEERKKGKRRASYSHYLTYYTGSMPPRPHFTWLHLAPLRSFSFAYRPAPMMLSLRRSLRRSSRSLLSLYSRLSSTRASREPLYILFLPFPSIHSILSSFSSIGTHHLFLLFPLIFFSSSLPLPHLTCYTLPFSSRIFLLLLLLYHSPLHSRASLAHPLFPVSSPATTPTDILIDRSCIRAQRVALWYRLNSHPSLPY